MWLNWTKLVGKNRLLYSVSIWKYITKIRHEEKTFDHLHLLLAYYIFLSEILQIESVMILNFEDVWRKFEKCLSKNNKNHLIGLSQ